MIHPLDSSASEELALMIQVPAGMHCSVEREQQNVCSKKKTIARTDWRRTFEKNS